MLAGDINSNDNVEDPIFPFVLKLGTPVKINSYHLSEKGVQMTEFVFSFFP